MAFACQTRCSLNILGTLAISFYTGKNHPGNNTDSKFWNREVWSAFTCKMQGNLKLAAAKAILKAPRIQIHGCKIVPESFTSIFFGLIRRRRKRVLITHPYRSSSLGLHQLILCHWELVNAGNFAGGTQQLWGLAGFTAPALPQTQTF